MDIHGYVLVYSITSLKSFDVVKIIYEKLNDYNGKLQYVYYYLILNFILLRYFHVPLIELKRNFKRCSLFLVLSPFYCYSHEKRVPISTVSIRQTAQNLFLSLLLILYINLFSIILLLHILSKVLFNYTLCFRVPIVLVGNKTDLHMDRMVSTEEGRRLASLWKAEFLETSAKQNEVSSMATTKIRITFYV